MHSPAHGSFFGSVVLLIKTTVGAGILTIPGAFSQTGYFAGTLSIFAVSLIMFSTLQTLQRASDKSSSLAHIYQEVVREHLGHGAGLIADVAICLYQVMSCCAFLIIVGDSFHWRFANLFAVDDPLVWLSRPLATFFCSLPGFALCFYPRMAQLSKSMGFGVAVVSVIAAFIVFDSLVAGDIAADVQALPSRVDRSFSALSVFAFALQCHIAAPRILFELSPDLSEKRTTIALLAYSYIVLLYTLVGYCGYRKFGAGVAGNVMLSFQGMTFALLSSLNGLQAIFGYALNQYMARAATYSLLVRMGILGASQSNEEPMLGPSSEIPQPHRHRLTVCVYLVTLTVACICNDLGRFATVLGASVGTLVIFVFPALLCWKLDGSSLFGRLKAAFYILSGAFILVSGLLSLFV